MHHGKGFIDIGSLIIFFLVAVPAILTLFRFAWKKGPQQPTALFKIYLNTSIVIGMGIICMAVSGANELLYALFGISMILWNLVSAISAYMAPSKWAAYPLTYILMFGALLAYSAFVGDFAHSPQKMATSISIFGVAVTIGAICTKGMIQKEVVSPAVAENPGLSKEE